MINCGDPSLNLTLEKKTFLSGSAPFSFAFETIPSITCLQGFLMDSINSTYKMSCTATGLWSTGPACNGRLKYKHIHM